MLKNQSLPMRRFIARYMNYVEVFGYLFVLTILGGILFACFYRMDVTAAHEKDPEIRAHEVLVRAARDTAVSRLLVTEPLAPVQAGQPIAEVWEGTPDAVDRLRGVAALESMARRDSAMAGTSGETIRALSAT
jgi:hypothetical protein